MLISYIITILFLLILSAFFSSAEVSYTLLRKREMPPQKFFSTILILNNVVNIGIASLTTYIASKILMPQFLIIVTLLVSGIIIVFGEYLPKIWAFKFYKDIGSIQIKIIKLLYQITKPINSLLEKISKFEYEKVEEEFLMIRGIEKIKEMEIKDIMIPKHKVDFIDIDKDTIEDVKKRIMETKHTRYPVLKNGKVVGILLAKDLIGKEISIDNLVSIIRTPHIAPITKPIYEQFLDFKNWKSHMVCVVDDAGEFLGIVTLEDIIEEIIGEIQDEYDEERKPFWKDGEKMFSRGDIHIRDFNREFRTDIPENYPTFTSLILGELGRMPKKGDKVEIEKWEIKVEDDKFPDIVVSIKIK